MIVILLTKFKLFLRNPFTFLIFTAMSIGFALVIGVSDSPTTIQVPVHAANEEVRESFIGNAIDENDTFTFSWLTEDELYERITNGNAEIGLILDRDQYQMVVGVDSPNSFAVEQSIEELYRKQKQQELILQTSNATTVDEKAQLLDEMEQAREDPLFTIDTGHFRGSTDWVYDSTFQTLFGFTLFFVIYTIAYNVLPILIERKEGIWDRMILSPVRKWEMYVANLVYSFIEGYLQIVVIFLVFRFGVGVEFNGRFVEALILTIPYTFALVALAIFLTAIVKNTQQFNAVIPIIAVSMAMIGGGFWPIEIVESKILLALSKINPLTYGMEILNGVAIYGLSIEELLYPISILLLMGVILMGVGIHLMERRHI